VIVDYWRSALKAKIEAENKLALIGGIEFKYLKRFLRISKLEMRKIVSNLLLIKPFSSRPISFF
jgi:hypothetical protein